MISIQYEQCVYGITKWQVDGDDKWYVVMSMIMTGQSLNV